MWRIVTLKQPALLLLTVVICGVTFFFCVGRQWMWRQDSKVGPVTQMVLVYPDELTVKGNFMTAVGKDLATNKRESITMTVKGAQVARELAESTRPVIWKISGKMQPFLPNTNENQFNYQRYNYHRRLTTHVQINELQEVVPVEKMGIVGNCHYRRACLSHYFATMPSPLDSYCLQLIVGKASEETTDLLASVKKLGLLHLFCISGMHVVLLTVLLRKLLVYLWWDREVIDWLLICLLPLYLIIGGGATSLIRATIMAEMGLLHRYLHLDALDGWAISLLAGLVIDPSLLLTLGGQLSYLLSFMLQVLPRQLTSFKQAVLLNLVSVPSILSFVYELHLLSFLASYVVIPVFAVVIFPAVIIAACCYCFMPAMTYLINDGLLIFHRLLDWCSRLPGEILFGKPPLFLALLLFILTVYAIDHRSLKRVWLMVAGTYLLTMALIHVPLKGEVVFFDIGQGDAIIIREPFNRQVLLIDTGGKVNFGRPSWAKPVSSRDDGERIIVNYLKSQGIDHLDTIFLSHHDADHIGYLPSILAHLTVDQIVVPAGMEKQPALLKRLAEGTSRPSLVPVTDQVQLQTLPLQILHPFAPGEAKNEDSLVLAGQFGGARFVFTGDLDRENEKKVMEKYPNLRADILKLGHHGSKTASDPAFLHQLQAQYGIISAGRFNRYHHPDDITIANLRQANIIPLSTQQYGMIKYSYYRDKGKIKTYLRGDELKWTLPSCLSN
jgi:competence protein ComEC